MTERNMQKALEEAKRVVGLIEADALTEEQKENNRQKSKIRCRIEHIFGQMTGQLHGINVRSIGLTRAWFNIGLLNLVYNFMRYEFLKRPKPPKGISAPC